MITDFGKAFQFILGEEEYKEIYKKFNRSIINKIFPQITVLGLGFHNYEKQKQLQKKIEEFKIVDQLYQKNVRKLRDEQQVIMSLIDKDGILKAKVDHFMNLFNTMDFNLFHIENKIYFSGEFSKLANTVTKASTDQMKYLFKDVKDSTELFNKLVIGRKEVYMIETTANLGIEGEVFKKSLGKLFEIDSWLFSEIKRCKKLLKSN